MKPLYSDLNGDQVDQFTQPRLYEVIYKKDKKGIIEKLTGKLELIQTTLINEYEIEKETIKRCVFEILQEIAYLFKVEQYESEKEVRAFEYLPIKSDKVEIDDSPIGKLFTTTDPTLFGENSEIIIGPKVSDKKAVELSIKKRLLINGHKETQVSHSKISYK